MRAIKSMPVEFNAWMLFRVLVDLILFNDFFSYILFVAAYWRRPQLEDVFDGLRVAGGVCLILVNLWVKCDAHRVVQDYAWYWGDFFFLRSEGELAFDGVFSLVPHPMYTLGYLPVG